jgi:hypothetical protein
LADGITQDLDFIGQSRTLVQAHHKGQWSIGGELPGPIDDELFGFRIQILLAKGSRVNGIKELPRFRKVDLDDLSGRWDVILSR